MNDRVTWVRAGGRDDMDQIPEFRALCRAFSGAAAQT